MHKQIKAIIWDWGGIFCVPGEHFWNKKMLERVGLTADEMSEQCRSLEFKLYDAQISPQEFWQEVFKKYDLHDFTYDQVNNSYLESYTLYPEILDLAKQLKSKYRCALLSNLAIDMSEHITCKYELKQIFDPLIFSHQIGHIKPDKMAYQIALDKLALPAQSCLFIDDSEKNILAAENLGIKSILSKKPSDTFSKLQEMGII